MAERHATRRWLWVVLALVVVVLVILLIRSRSSAEDDGGSGPQEAASVVLARVSGAELTRTIEAVANVEAAESVSVTAEASGRVVTVLFTEGERVGRGQPLFRLESDQEQADLSAALADAAQLRQRLGRQQRLLADGAIARGAVEDLQRELQAAEARAASLRTIVEDTVVRAPFSGTIGLRRVSPGALVQPGDELVTLDDARSVRLRFTIPEAQLAQVRPGAEVEATSPAIPDRRFAGTVTGFDSRLGAGQRTLQGQALLPNGDGQWRPGMLADLRIATETVPQAVTVPPIAVQVRGDVQFVIRAVDGCAQRVDVKTGQRERDRLEIVSGLRAGDSVVVEGFQDLATGDPIKAVAPGRPRGDQAGGREKAEAGKDEKASKGGQASEDRKKAFEQAQQRCQAVVRRLEQARDQQPAAPR